MHFNLYRDQAGEWRWRLIASNGNTIADSGEGYTTKANAQHGIDAVKQGAAAAPVREDKRDE
jgi:uncharacterized protein